MIDLLVHVLSCLSLNFLSRFIPLYVLTKNKKKNRKATYTKIYRYNSLSGKRERLQEHIWTLYASEVTVKYYFRCCRYSGLTIIMAHYLTSKDIGSPLQRPFSAIRRSLRLQVELWGRGTAVHEEHKLDNMGALVAKADCSLVLLSFLLSVVRKEM